MIQYAYKSSEAKIFQSSIHTYAQKKIHFLIKSDFLSSDVFVLGHDSFSNEFVFSLKIFTRGLREQNNTSGSLGLSSNTELHSASDIHIRNTIIFTEDGDVRDDINRTDISSQNADTFSSLPKGLD